MSLYLLLRRSLLLYLHVRAVTRILGRLLGQLLGPGEQQEVRRGARYEESTGRSSYFTTTLATQVSRSHQPES